MSISGAEVSSKSRKRKIESDESNDEDAVSEEISLGGKSVSSSDVDTSQTFGLKYEFLKRLGIKPPIEKWVYVSNFRCDKSELKEILELAGHVITCAVFMKSVRSAKVMYSHPLEAVQAISMLNDQIYYGQKLHVSMINCPSDLLILPKGLSNVGPGLGAYGKPLRDVVKHYRKYVKRQNSSLDYSLFRNCDGINDENDRISEDDATEINVSSKKSDGRNSERSFKTANVEDLPDDAEVSENKTKKPKQGSEMSDSECEERDTLGKKINQTKDVENKATAKVTTQAVSLDSDKKTPSTIEEKKTSSVHVPVPQLTTVTTQNYRPCPPNPQMAPGPVRMVTSSGPIQPPLPPFVPTPVGSIYNPSGPMAPQFGPVGPPGPSAPPLCPPMRPICSVSGAAAVCSVMSGPVPMGPMIRPPGPIGPSMRPPGTMGPMVGPMGAVGTPGPPMGPPVGVFAPPGPYQPGSLQNPNLVQVINNSPPAQAISLQFRNLPPTTTFPLLCDKVSQCGQLLSLQLTTPGCAHAVFAHRAHADRCFQVFNGKCIDGHVIEMRYI